MPAISFKANKTAPTAGTAADASLVAASSGNSVVVWAVLASGTATDPLLLKDGSGGTTLLKVQIPANSSFLLPYTGTPYCQTTIGTGLFQNAAATSTVTVWYSIP